MLFVLCSRFMVLCVRVQPLHALVLCVNAGVSRPKHQNHKRSRRQYDKHGQLKPLLLEPKAEAKNLLQSKLYHSQRERDLLKQRSKRMCPTAWQHFEWGNSIRKIRLGLVLTYHLIGKPGQLVSEGL